MTQLYHSAPSFENIVISQPLVPITLLDLIKKNFRNVIHKPPALKVLPSDEEFAEMDVLFCFNLPPNLINISQCPNLKLLQLFGAGTDHVTNSEFYKSIPDSNPLIIASATGIHVTISEHILATVLTLNHKVNQLILIAAIEKRWAPTTEFSPDGKYIQEIRNQTVGVLGYGQIGRETARMFNMMGAKIIACTRTGIATKAKGYQIEGTGDIDGSIPISYYKSTNKSDLKEFLNQCDVVVNTLPLSNETEDFMGEEEFKNMRGNALFVNIGRGNTVDLASLMIALKAECSEGEQEDATGSLRIGGASLDVTDPEPLPKNHPLYSFLNVILTPHMSGLSKTYDVRATDLMLQNLKRLKAGRGCLNAVRGRGEDD